MADPDLTGRSSGYRGVAIRCPGCAEPMSQLSLPKADAEVDVCNACGGLWIDWFDGEVKMVATETLGVADKPQLPSSSQAGRNEAIAIGACPRCTRQLVAERYAMKSEVASAGLEGRTSVVSGTTGAELMRCEECMGAFVNRASAEVLSWLSEHDEAPPSQAVKALEPLPWERLIALLKRILGTAT